MFSARLIVSYPELVKSVFCPKLANVTVEIKTDKPATIPAESDLEELAVLPAKTDRQLAEYVWGKLTLAVSLACRGEQERRSGHLASAAESHREWGSVMAEVKRLSPLVRNPSIASEKPFRSRQKRR